MKFEGSLPTSKIIYTDNSFSNGQWKFPEQMGIGHVGFIYVIRDNVLGRCYLGKKLYYGMGKLNKGKESNWKKYLSSSKLLAEVLEHDNKIAEAKLLEKLWNTSVSFFIDESTYNKHELDFYKEIIDPYKTLKTLNSYDSTQVNYRVNNKALLEEDSIYDYLTSV